jgi:3-deoxy-D-manno-octulosonic acid kinase
LKIPEGVERVDGRAGWGFAAPAAKELVAETLSRGSTLRAWAKGAPDTLLLEGRGPVYAVAAPTGGRWVVRPYHRGGAVAGPLLGDRHARVGVPRPVAEARASAAVLARGVPTPRVLAGAVYPSGPFYRADIVTQYIPASRDLAGALFPAAGEEHPDPLPLLEAAGSLVGRLARAGIEHRDLNARNILLVREGEAPVAMLLDLDRCRVRPPGTRLSPRTMLLRLERSLRKISERRGRPLSGAEWNRLRSAVPTP